MIGALSLEGGLTQPLAATGATGWPTTWFAGIGWKHYFEGHGRTQLRLMLTYEHGGVLSPRLEGTANRFGASAAFTLRRLSEQWFFGQLTALVDTSVITLRPPPNPFGQAGETRVGAQFGGGLETTFGTMFMLAPYLMAETGASLTANYVSPGDHASFELWARWVVRFDYGVRGAEK